MGYLCFEIIITSMVIITGLLSLPYSYPENITPDSEVEPKTMTIGMNNVFEVGCGILLTYSISRIISHWNHFMTIDYQKSPYLTTNSVTSPENWGQQRNWIKRWDVCNLCLTSSVLMCKQPTSAEKDESNTLYFVVQPTSVGMWSSPAAVSLEPSVRLTPVKSYLRTRSSTALVVWGGFRQRDHRYEYEDFGCKQVHQACDKLGD